MSTNPNPPNRNAPSPVFGALLTGAMVGLIATVVLIVMYEWGVVGAAGLGFSIGTIVGILLVLLFRRPLPPIQQSADAFEPLVGWREGKGPVRVDTHHGAQGQARTSAEAVSSAGTAGGHTIAAAPAAPGARSPRDPAEMPLPGAGGPTPSEPVPSVPESHVPEARVGAPVIPVSDAPSVRISQGEADPTEPAGIDTGTERSAAPDPAPSEPEASAYAAPPPEAAAPGTEPSADPEVVAPPAAEPDTSIPGSGDPGGVDPAMPGPSDNTDGIPASEAAAAFTEEGGADTAPAEVGQKPELIDGPRDGGGDDLKLIRGVGPKLEGMLHDMGVWHFDQIASWGPDEVAWVDANLEGFNGRVERDEWVSQAKVLASGGTTEFSERQDGGEG